MDLGAVWAFIAPVVAPIVFSVVAYLPLFGGWAGRSLLGDRSRFFL